MIEGWKYYNHAAVPTCAPHEQPDIKPLEKGLVWSKVQGAPLLERWTTDWDCDHETNWWYVIKDTPFDIVSLKSKRKYEINKGNKNFDVRVIDPQSFKDELFRVTVAAYSGWSEKYRPSVTKESIADAVQQWQEYLVFGA